MCKHFYMPDDGAQRNEQYIEAWMDNGARGASRRTYYNSAAAKR